MIFGCGDESYPSCQETCAKLDSCGLWVNEEGCFEACEADEGLFGGGLSDCIVHTPCDDINCKCFGDCDGPMEGENRGQSPLGF